MSTHHHDKPPTWEDQVDSLELDGHISLPWVDDALRWLIDIHPGGPIKHVFDIGSGPGYAACALALALPTAQVTALDPTLPLLERVRDRAGSLDIADRVIPFHGDIDTAVSTLAPAEIIWASHVIHHLPDPVAAMRTLGARLTDNGLLAVAEGGLPVRVLPGGYGVGSPSLPARLDAAMSDYWTSEWDLAELVAGGARDWPVLMADAGLTHHQSKTFILDHHAPVDERVREYVVKRYEDMRDLIADRLDPEDAAALDILLDVGDQRSLHLRPDVFLLTAQTIHTAKKRT